MQSFEYSDEAMVHKTTDAMAQSQDYYTSAWLYE